MFYSVVIVVTVVIDGIVARFFHSVLQIILFKYWIRTSVDILLFLDTDPHTKRCQDVTENA